MNGRRSKMEEQGELIVTSSSQFRDKRKDFNALS